MSRQPECSVVDANRALPAWSPLEIFSAINDLSINEIHVKRVFQDPPAKPDSLLRLSMLISNLDFPLTEGRSKNPSHLICSHSNLNGAYSLNELASFTLPLVSTVIDDHNEEQKDGWETDGENSQPPPEQFQSCAAVRTEPLGNIRRSRTLRTDVADAH